ncbi:S1 family peptidase [Flavobacterium sp. MFBS3-15]|uniref:S1 family peptidase n=1 Tax=Flavobacterium sp. MFBS3-15 TaxID=2989816 RepID=UPI002235EA43|nr:S1 family peptidase [Flavobacterium sp. MFBS3-15]MCW4470800.1 S1 family peptidase [Flavobacterium sp. MFBS3-15]
MLDEIIPLTVVLFLLSMVCERIADFLKHYLCGSKLFRIKDTLTKFPNDDNKEKARYYRIMKINIWCGIIVAAIFKADFIMIFNNMDDPGKTLGWTKEVLNEYYKEPIDYFIMVLGIALTGCFISFGSKFWHDLLDILYTIKNTRRVANDPATYEIDNAAALKKAAETYQSDFIQAAFLEVKAKFMANNNVKSISMKRRADGYYFEVSVEKSDAAIEPWYVYQAGGGIRHSIAVKQVVLEAGDKIVIQSVDLSSRIFDMQKPDGYGTIGVLVRKKESGAASRSLLTCFHNVSEPPYDTSKAIKAGTLYPGAATEIGDVVKKILDHEADAALIDINTDIDIRNYVPRMGTPGTARRLYNKDVDVTDVCLFGTKSGFRSGKVTGVYADIKIDYPGDRERTLINLIVISDNGTAMSKGGDSGCCVLDKDGKVIGIVLGGRKAETYVLPINTLIDRMDVELV